MNPINNARSGIQEKMLRAAYLIPDLGDTAPFRVSSSGRLRSLCLLRLRGLAAALCLAAVLVLASSELAVAETRTLAETDDTSEDNKAQLARAKQLFGQGIEASKEGRWRDARDAFQRSYAVVPRPITLLNLAGAYAQTEMFVEGAREYERFLRLELDPKSAKLRDVAKRELAKLEMRIPRLELQVQGRKPNDRVLLDGEDVPEKFLGGAPLRLNPGKHQVELKRPGYKPLRRLVEVEPGGRAKLMLNLSESGLLKPVWMGTSAEDSGAEQAAVSGTTRNATPADDEKARRRRRRIWIWTTVAVLVAGGAVATAVLLTRDDNSFPSNSGTVTINFGR